MMPVSSEPIVATGTDVIDSGPRSRRTGWFFALGLVLVVALSAAYLGPRPTPVGQLATNALASPTATPTIVVTTPPTPAFDGDLRTLLIPKPSSAKVQEGVRESTGGNVSAEQAGKVFETDLRPFGFQRGATTGWADTKGYVVFIDLYQFGLAMDAADFARATQQPWVDDTDPKSTGYLDGIVNGRWFIEKFRPASSGR